MLADGSKTDRRNAVVQSFSDGCMPNNAQGQERADGSEECMNVVSKLEAMSGRSVSTATATSTTTALLDSVSVVPTCTPFDNHRFIRPHHPGTLHMQCCALQRHLPRNAAGSQ